MWIAVRWLIIMAIGATFWGGFFFPPLWIATAVLCALLILLGGSDDGSDG